MRRLQDLIALDYGLALRPRPACWVDGPGRFVLEDNPIRRFAGALTHCYEPGALDRLRDEWARPGR
ncbi:MAG: hypothetical protein H8E59_03010 [Actinobacteria bacterium]|nr:hypothetical protein [Actinomycetota bacterium]